MNLGNQKMSVQTFGANHDKANSQSPAGRYSNFVNEESNRTEEFQK